MRAKRFAKILAILLLIASLVGLTLYALQENISLYQTPSEWLKHPIYSKFRLGGLVQNLTQKKAQFTFKITDGKHALPVVFEGVLPALFKEGKGAIVSGQMVENTFVATTVLAKHDENYQPRLQR